MTVTHSPGATVEVDAVQDRASPPSDHAAARRTPDRAVLTARTRFARPQHQDEERRAEERGDDADRDLARGRDGAGDQVGQDRNAPPKSIDSGRISR